jgi:hypothetical protein
MSAMMSQGLEQARTAMEQYLKFFQNGMAAAPWSSSEMNKKMTEYARRNVDTAFDYAQKLTQAKSLPDLMRIQSEYFQTQLSSLTEQAKDLGETATKTAASKMRME